jgi:acetyl esterase
VDARLYEGASHSFLEAVAIAPLAARALAESAGWLAQQLGGR